MNLIDQYRDEIVSVTHNYLDKLITDIYEVVGFNKMFVYNTYEGEGISCTSIAFSPEDEIYLGVELLPVFNEHMLNAIPVDIDEQDIENMSVAFEMLMYNSYGFDWYIAVELVDEKLKYSVHVLESENLDF